MSVEDVNGMQLTADGYPIGEIVISTGESVPRRPSIEDLIEENRIARATEATMELTNDPGVDPDILEYYPGYDNVELRQKAARMFIEERLDCTEIGEKLGVPGRTVSQWAYVHKWEDLLRRELAVQHSQSVLNLARLRNERRLSVAREQLDQAKKIRDRAMQAIESGDTSIKSGAEAWAAAAKIEHTLTGVSEAGSVTDVNGKQEADKKDNNGKTPLVVVFQGGGLPPIRKQGQTIDV